MLKSLIIVKKNSIAIVPFSLQELDYKMETRQKDPIHIKVKFKKTGNK
jgi:hypothetical protein